MNTAVVTGASSGLGAIFAEQLAQRGHPLVLAGRDQARLEQVKRRIGSSTQVELVVSDLGADGGVEELIARLNGRTIDVLVNNAGFGTYGPFADIDGRRAARPGPGPRGGRPRMAQQGDDNGRTARTRLALGPHERADAAAR
ncbi:hypothetical protein MMAN_18610 [Mycobacterium mantenii]|uniref:Short-chain dehydrogenase n=1 Tax=Mycobacterium mantenii TaxID=560555 RepID=A0A1X0FAH6_MYCNT|nr:SDR family NAD(P)-dependent oxidoreductase [Mycobacterium mantenii]MCV7245292.1 SDR family NAD(P)-dependent oxidoreductase [Mycobacterium mantenii]ORA98795.1 hypothetical protein BST30_25435 [Mycobacterium mantenii]BBY37727.1 hypothetical protein MMAN_18610 [Mycobacterium mantenii]